MGGSRAGTGIIPTILLALVLVTIVLFMWQQQRHYVQLAELGEDLTSHGSEIEKLSGRLARLADEQKALREKILSGGVVTTDGEGDERSREHREECKASQRGHCRYS